MCLFSTRPRWEEEVEFTGPPRKAKVTYVARPTSHRVSETIIRESRPPSEPIIRIATPPRSLRVSSPHLPPPPSSPPRIELVSVEEMRVNSSPRTSKVSVSNHGRSRRGSSKGEVEEYIERERIRERMPPPKEEYETYRYVEGPRAEQDRIDRRRSRSITYETNPRHSGRLVERERVVIEDGGRRREYYRRP